MLKKIKNFCFDEYTFKGVVIGCLILVTVAIFTVGFNDLVKPFLVYPEEEYQMLEKEAERIIDEQTLNTEFKHDVNYSNTLESKSIEIKLWDKNACVIIDVDNYDETTESITVSRNMLKNAGYYIIGILTLIFGILLTTFIVVGLAGCILFIVGNVCKFFDWMITALKY